MEPTVYWVRYEDTKGITTGAWFEYDLAQQVYNTCLNSPKFKQDGNTNLRIEAEPMAVADD